MNDSERNPPNDLTPGPLKPSLVTPAEDPARRVYNGEPDSLHDLFITASSEEEEDPLAALRSDPNYAALIRDLEYIASQARLLFQPAEQTPSDEVWKKIQNQLPGRPEGQ